MLSAAFTLYDPLEFLSPVILSAKRIILSTKQDYEFGVDLMIPWDFYNPRSLRQTDSKKNLTCCCGLGQSDFLGNSTTIEQVDYYP